MLARDESCAEDERGREAYKRLSPGRSVGVATSLHTEPRRGTPSAGVRLQSTDQIMDEALTRLGMPVPDSALARRARELITDIAAPFLVNHSVRSYAWAVELARHDRLQFDPEILHGGRPRLRSWSHRSQSTRRSDTSRCEGPAGRREHARGSVNGGDLDQPMRRRVLSRSDRGLRCPRLVSRTADSGGDLTNGPARFRSRPETGSNLDRDWRSDHG
jgi:hypothetical protein